MAVVVLELDEDGVRFRHGAEEREANGQLDTLLDQRASGSLSEEKFHLALADLVEHYPDYIDGHAHLGFVMLERGKAKQALDACERGLGIGLAAIPRTYRGRIEWSWLENRLSCAQLMVSLYATRNLVDGIRQSRCWSICCAGIPATTKASAS